MMVQEEGFEISTMQNRTVNQRRSFLVVPAIVGCLLSQQEAGLWQSFYMLPVYMDKSEATCPKVSPAVFFKNGLSHLLR